MYSRDVQPLRPEDLFVALELALAGAAGISGRALAGRLDMPTSSVGVSLRRLRANGLVESSAGGYRVRRLALRECLQSAARWIAPARVGSVVLGLPTGSSSPALAAKFRGDPDPLVIPLDEGPARGRAVPPLHAKAPVRAARNPNLHALLGVVDALRVGGARERGIAAAELGALL